VEPEDPTLDRLVAGNDLDDLVREVDRRTEAADWDGLVRLRDRCRAALERGLQLWPAASLAEYRLALRAPAAWAGAVVVEGAGRFALGPLAEVAASTHPWADLAPHLAPGPLARVRAGDADLPGAALRVLHLRRAAAAGRVLTAPSPGTDGYWTRARRHSPSPSSRNLHRNR
jgi:hypothetical protein